MSRTDSDHIVSAETMGSFKSKLNQFMDEDDWWNKTKVFTQGLPKVSLMPSCNFPHFLMFLYECDLYISVFFIISTICYSSIYLI